MTIIKNGVRGIKNNVCVFIEAPISRSNAFATIVIYCMCFVGVRIFSIVAPRLTGVTLQANMYVVFMRCDLVAAIVNHIQHYREGRGCRIGPHGRCARVE